MANKLLQSAGNLAVVLLVQVICSVFGVCTAISAPIEKTEGHIQAKVSSQGDIINVLTWVRGQPYQAPKWEVNASLYGQPLPPTGFAQYPWDKARIAILFLVDVSDPRRKKVVKQNAQTIINLLAQHQPHHLFSLAEFDSDFRVLVPFPDAPGAGNIDAVIDAAPSLVAKGRSTEFFRSLRDAVKNVKSVAADRHVIFVFSDGNAEDRGYTLKDVIDTANKEEVIFYGIGAPPPKFSDSVALGNLRALAEKTGGVYLPTEPPDYEVDKGFVFAPYAVIDSGFRVDYSTRGMFRIPFIDPPAVAKVQVDIKDGKPIIVDVPVSLPWPRLDQWRDVAALDRYENYVLGVLAVAALIALMILYYLLRFIVRVIARMQERRPIAFLEILDSSEKKFAVRSTSLRIGRDPKANDFVIENGSVSGHHAVISRRRDKNFVINDQASTNGVLVNGEEVTEQLLSGGDIIELGDVRLRFLLS